MLCMLHVVFCFICMAPSSCTILWLYCTHLIYLHSWWLLLWNPEWKHAPFVHLNISCRCSGGLLHERLLFTQSSKHVMSELYSPINRVVMSGETPTLKLQLHDVAGTVLVGLCGKIHISNLHASVEFSLLSMQLLCSLHVHDWGEPEGAPH